MTDEELAEVVRVAGMLKGWERSIAPPDEASYRAAEQGEDSEEVMRCPLCEGEGEVDGQRYDAKAVLPATLVGYGIGEGLKASEFWAEHSVEAVLTLRSRAEDFARKLAEMSTENERLREGLYRTMEAARRHDPMCKAVGIAEIFLKGERL